MPKETLLRVLVAGLVAYPGVAFAQVQIPSTDTALAKADRSTRLVALAAGCDTLSVDGTWQTHRLPEAHGSVRLPSVFGERGDVFPAWFHDSGPGVPPKRYVLHHPDPITGRLLFDEATVTVPCLSMVSASSGALQDIWIAGYGYHPVGSVDSPYSIWYVFGSFGFSEHNRQWLYGMSRDLWGARVLVSAMRQAVFAPSLPR
jgi:hypothetical protein